MCALWKSAASENNPREIFALKFRRRQMLLLTFHSAFPIEFLVSTGRDVMQTMDLGCAFKWSLTNFKTVI